MHNSNDLFQIMVEYAGIGIALVGPDGHIVQANRRLCDMLGYPVHDLLGKSLADISHPDDLSRDLHLLDELISGKRPVYSFDKRYIHADGRIVWGRLTVTIARSDDGSPEHVIAMMEDITEERRLSHAVGERVKELNALHALSRQLLRADITDVQQMLHVVADILPPAFQYPDITAARVRLGHRVALTSGFTEGRANLRTRWTDTTGTDGSIEVIYTAPAPAAAEGPFLVEERALIESMAELLRIAVDRLRVSEEHRQVELALRTSEERLQLAVDASGMGTIEWDFAIERASISEITRRIFCFPEGTTSVTADQFRDRIHPDDRDEVRRAFHSERAGDAARDLEYRLQLPGGVQRWINVRGRNFFTEHGEASRRVSVVLDVSARALLEQQYRHAQKMEAVGRLAGGVAHDFNNLLTVIGAAAEFAQEETAPGSQVHDDVQDIVDAVGRARSLTSQLLTFSRRQVVRLSRVSVDTVVRGTEKMLRRLVGENVVLELSLGGSLPPILADTGQLEQVLVNLVVNARDAMPDGGTISIATSMRAPERDDVTALPQFVRLTIRDTGTGIDDTTRTRIFEPFFTTKEAGKGTGLGLATVFGIVKQAGGHIGVETALGAGTQFIIDLPIAPSGVSAATGDSLMASAAAGGNETILLVEDEPHVRLLARRILMERGYEVLDAHSANEALAVAAAISGPVHLLLTDVVLPEQNGRVLADAIVAVRPEIRVLFMSGYTADALLHHRISESGIPIIEKPFTRDSLAAAVRGVLDRA